MGNCATCCGKADTHEVDTTEKLKTGGKLKAESGFPGAANDMKKYPGTNYIIMFKNYVHLIYLQFA